MDGDELWMRGKRKEKIDDKREMISIENNYDSNLSVYSTMFSDYTINILEPDELFTLCMISRHAYIQQLAILSKSNE